MSCAHWADLMPCWGRHERIGHSTCYGWFEVAGHDVALCRVPLRDGETGRVLILPMGGASFYGFEALPEEDVMRTLFPLSYPMRPAFGGADADAHPSPSNAQIGDALKILASLGIQTKADPFLEMASWFKVTSVSAFSRDMVLLVEQLGELAPKTLQPLAAWFELEWDDFWLVLSDLLFVTSREKSVELDEIPF